MQPEKYLFKSDKKKSRKIENEYKRENNRPLDARRPTRMCKWWSARTWWWWPPSRLWYPKCSPKWTQSFRPRATSSSPSPWAYPSPISNRLVPPANFAISPRKWLFSTKNRKMLPFIPRSPNDCLGKWNQCRSVEKTNETKSIVDPDLVRSCLHEGYINFQ